MNTAERIVECVPNFSEGRNEGVLRSITDAIQSVPGVQLLNVDPGQEMNRTVVTFTGSPEEVEAVRQGRAEQAQTQQLIEAAPAAAGLLKGAQ